MHDINPLGTTMHLRELDRRAAPTVRTLPSRKPAASEAPLIRVALSRVLNGLRAGYASIGIRAS
jgi:hypothetical protein